jgi:hypothetical protein
LHREEKPRRGEPRGARADGRRPDGRRSDERRPPLGGIRIALLGGFESLPRRRLVWEIERRGGRCVRHGLGAAPVAVLGHGVAAWADTGELAALLAEAAGRGCAVVSEHRFLRRLGLLPALPPAFRTLSLDDLARRSGLSRDTLIVLRLLDLVEDEGGRFEFRDLVAARRIADLVAAGASFAAIAEGAMRLRRRGIDAHPLARAHLVRAAAGDIVLRFGRHVAATDGQLDLPLGDGGNPSREVPHRRDHRAEARGLLLADRAGPTPDVAEAPRLPVL